jgi:hypothetical protein
MYSAESPVKHEKVSFDGTTISLGLKARRDIPAGCPILSTSTSLSLDLVPPGMSGISVIEASSGQKGPLGRRVMLGPLRFANQDCQPNGQVKLSLVIPNVYTQILYRSGALPILMLICSGLSKKSRKGSRSPYGTGKTRPILLTNVPVRLANLITLR